ncbi:MAG TPA: LPS export ABC transporter permease LptF [Pseudomonas xinjiangensis]|uniref:Lipopolysaccharide export system permease protein LptF n=2 Tax=root TaxID=1 RepID=A0A7V1BMH9_9GAMM|nr:LPS export ABC transporter permease LptF [Halopseudomonas xinjiangensis]HEC49192.1 LPS export ABC transporter permease LptF [Halopseudomonas xinjiangensis]
MIVFRYLSREVLMTLTAVSGVLLLIIMSGRFIKYLAQAAAGQLDPGVLFLIMGYRLPGFMVLILPLGMFLGILLAYGRLHLESEMTVLSATGISDRKILAYTQGPALLVAVAVAWLSLWVAPAGVVKTQQLFNQQDAMTEFDTLAAGRFQSIGREAQRVTYAGGLSADRTELQQVFIAERVGSGDDSSIGVLIAESGRQQTNPDGSRYLVLDEGYRYDGKPGTADFRTIQYDTYGVLLPQPEVVTEITDREAIPTRLLVGEPDLLTRAELQWRIALPLLVPIVAFFAVPLARVNPRQGRFLKLLPAVILYMSYLALLISARGWMESGTIPAVLGLWWVHIVFLIVGLTLNFTSLFAPNGPRRTAHAPA